MASDPFVELRSQLHAAINATIDGLDFSHSQLLESRASALLSHDARDEFVPALLCAFTAVSLGATNEDALAAATSLALVEASAHVVDDLVLAASGSDVDPRGLIEEWGVPRTLNAADAFFALANEALMRLQDRGFAAGRVLAIANELNEGVRAWSEESDARFTAEEFVTQHPSYALLTAAVRVGALTAGFEGDIDALSAGVVQDDSDAIWTSLHPSAAPPFAEAASYLAGVPRT